MACGEERRAQAFKRIGPWVHQHKANLSKQAAAKRKETKQGASKTRKKGPEAFLTPDANILFAICHQDLSHLLKPMIFFFQTKSDFFLVGFPKNSAMTCRSTFVINIYLE